MKEEDVSLLENMITGHWYGESRNKLLSDWVFDNFKTNQNILEIGSGTGTILNIIKSKGFSVEGIEPTVSGYNAGIKKGLDIKNISLMDFNPGKKYDGVIAFDVLEHIENDQEALKYIYEVLLKPGGKLLLAVPVDPKLWSQLDVDVFHFRRYTKSNLFRLLEEEKFKIMKWRKWIVLLYPAVYIHRKFRNSGYQAENNKPNKIANSFLTFIGILERKLILNFLPGVSIIVLAEKVI